MCHVLYSDGLLREVPLYMCIVHTTVQFIAHRIKEANENHASALDTLKIDHSKEIVGYQKSVQDLTGQKDKEVRNGLYVFTDMIH